jgi:small conductance mechanosensitive channel
MITELYNFVLIWRKVMFGFKQGSKVSAVFLALLFIISWTEVRADIDVLASPAANVEIDKEELGYRLVPLNQGDLTTLAAHWTWLLQEQLKIISETQIKIASAEGDAKDKLLEELNQQREQQTLLIDKTNLVLADLNEKGGDIAEQEQYINAVSGIKMNGKDSNVVFSSITGWLKSPEGGMRWLTNIFLFLVTMFVFKILAGVFAGITEHSVDRLKGASDLLKHFFVNLARNLTLIIGFMVALSMLEINIAPLLAGLGAVAFIVGFALQGTLSNFASGLMILIYRPYDIGDVINVAGTLGSVHSMTLVSTTLKLPDNQIVVIPNNAIWGSTITNVTGSATRRVDMVFGIGYGDDIAKAEAVLVKILANHNLVLKDPEPVIKVHELADSSVNFVVRPWVKTSDYFAVYWDVTRAVKERFDAVGISIPFPQQDVYMHTVDAGNT